MDLASAASFVLDLTVQKYSYFSAQRGLFLLVLW